MTTEERRLKTHIKLLLWKSQLEDDLRRSAAMLVLSAAALAVVLAMYAAMF